MSISLRCEYGAHARESMGKQCTSDDTAQDNLQSNTSRKAIGWPKADVTGDKSLQRWDQCLHAWQSAIAISGENQIKDEPLVVQLDSPRET
jgi:hypothetical protein